jgi:GPH family glycoside/pentoside/hexuronide:cation symporter
MWSLVEALAPFIVKYFLGGEVADITFIGAPMILFPIFSYFLWRKLSLRFGYKVILGATTVTISLVLVAICWTTTILQAAILTSLFGFINGGVQLTRELLIPDVVDDDARRTGVRREGIYYGARTFIDRFALALTGISTAFIFNFSGYISGLDTQPAHVVQLMRLSATVVFAIALILFLIAFKYYPFGKKNQ